MDELLVIGKAICVLFMIIGIYTLIIKLQYFLTKNKVEKVENNWQFDDIMKYNKNGGEPLILVNPEYKSTMFFMEGFRTQNPAGMYIDWLKKLHEKHKVNIIVPVYGLQSSPFKLRNRSSNWHFEEDIRTCVQIYDAYTSLLPKEHKVITVSQSFGTLPNLVIASKGIRKPDKMFLLSPLNTGMEFRASGKLVYWLSKQSAWLQHIVKFSYASPASGRKSIWDIVNEEKNINTDKLNNANLEDSAAYGYQVEKVAKWIETVLIPKISNMNITLVWGEEDLYFSQQGFINLAKLLKDNGNIIDELSLKNSGHMVLLDNGEDILKKLIENELK